MSGTSPGQIDAENLTDAHVRAVLLQYAALVGAQVSERNPHLLEVVLPPAERHLFSARPGFAQHGVLKIATTLDALEEEPEAELAVIGGPLFEHLVEAIRRRGHRLAFGLLPVSHSPDAKAAMLWVPLKLATASDATVSTEAHPVGRLLARVLVRAGADAEEVLVESAVFDLVTGQRLEEAIERACVVGTAVQDPSEEPYLVAVPMPPDRLLALMTSDLEQRLAPEFAKRRSDAARNLAVELGRIDFYYKSLLEGPAGPGTDVETGEQREVFLAEHSRRRDEEVRRHHLRVAIQPVQLTEWQLLVQDARWTLTSTTGHVGMVSATRALSGSGAWQMTCPSCGGSPGGLAVCKYGHAGCEGCTTSCVVCGEVSCADHAPAKCHVDGGAACDEHARSCVSCRRAFCTSHQATCTQGSHQVCVSCAMICGVCCRAICSGHAETSAASAPKGERRLCGDCAVLCEGGRNEVVGKDEVLRCASCERSVCGSHQATCDLDGRTHCSAHFRRSDRSRRLVCMKHQATCAYEPNAVFAADEVHACRGCSAVACGAHLGECVADGERYCRSHLEALADQPGKTACEPHRTQCSIDGLYFSLGATQACGVCGQGACAEHLDMCTNCGRAVCRNDHEVKSRHCKTCLRLAENDVPVEMMAAAIAANGGIPPKGKTWRAARDVRSTVVDVDLGWSRHLVFTVPHGAQEPDTIVTHSLLGTKRMK